MSNAHHNQSQQSAVIVPASAGSGKTYRIAQEYIYDTLRNRTDSEGREYFDPTVYKRILAVTFTNKATEEMKSRILNEIHLLASNKESAHLKDLIAKTGLDEATLRKRAKVVRSAILHDYSHFTILTNDTFFQRVLRAFIRELSIDLNVSTEIDSAPILQRSVDALIEDITSDEGLRRWLEELTEDSIDEGGKWDIRTSIMRLNKELFKESNRDVIAQLSNKDNLKKIVTSFVAFADNSTKEYALLGAKALDIIKRSGYEHSNFSGNFTAIFEKIANRNTSCFTDTAVKRCECAPEEWLRKNDRNDLSLVACAEELQTILQEAYKEAKTVSKLLNSSRIISRNYRSFALLKDLQHKVEDICREENTLLLSETKHTIAQFITEQDAPFIYEKFGNYFDKFMIDEFQDTSLKEWHNFLPLLKNAMSQNEDNAVLIVGDVKQSIYRFRGSDWNILGSIAPNDLGSYKRIPLDNNWRSLPEVVEFNNRLFGQLIESSNLTLNTMLRNALANNHISHECCDELCDTLKNAYSDLQQIPRRKHQNRGYVDITYTPRSATQSVETMADNGECQTDTSSKIPAYIERIKTLFAKGFIPRDITILVRSGYEGVRVAEELLARRNELGYNFEITTEEALSINNSPATKLIMAVMRLAINRYDTPSLAIYNLLHHKGAFDHTLSDEEHHFLDTIKVLTAEEAFEHIIIRFADDIEGQTAYVQALHNHIVRYSSSRVSDIALFDKWWRESGDGQSIRVEKSDNAIEIMTIHKAKGLENKVIIIPFCSWSFAPKSDSFRTSNIVWSRPIQSQHLSDLGAFPVPFNSDMSNSFFAEGFYREQVYSYVDAINLLYVAVTRAKEQLHIFAEQKRLRHIGDILIEALIQHTFTDAQGIIHYTSGSFDAPEVELSDKERNRVDNVLLDRYHASPIGTSLRTSTSRYFAKGEGCDMSPRSMGIRLHRAFEGASTRKDIFDALEKMMLEGTLSEPEYNHLCRQITTTLDTTIAGEWFDQRWQHIYHERSILRHDGNIKRPDRVMQRGKDIVIVDYKFGEETASHHKQMAEYMAELREMGYSHIEGYLWYVASGKVVRVDEVKS